ncbi:hypothetical protein ACH5RR_017274 [Cinchona calisaya]|uniref:Senescence regulator S40 n=1 Tax=Cinchona calisaya TaxID=153742 RepID=A0ABD3A1J9_9GENT
MASPSPTVRFLGLLEQPEPDPNNNINNSSNHNTLELDESDVVWSSSSAYSTDTDSHSPPRSSNSPTTHFSRHRNPLNPPNYGLSAALSDDHHPPLVRRKSSLNPSLSAASAARMVPPVVRSENSNLNSNAGRFHQSAPVNVPVWPKKKVEEFDSLERLDEVDDEKEDEEEMVPPHVIVARSHVTFSVFEGVGRTLKGRDLRSVRNAVFQKTGFLD